ncbi:glycosyl-4,4'-diaponeurosporenoate acyltransferase CrtO family protein [Hymenobacter fodinae]|uniref:Glycosyl-4,4'-diaponeurosporenoate acyltransferase n=1 Tax=Hymenobacter fodinae TaxID=2510796 RepID=A0A4Z0PB54_9BACT|nr:hypothetical protein [Hymenobacter fodinae]TGE09478.1 hypothetical protein EU556_01185 [Hymenobacter fodinae]
MTSTPTPALPSPAVLAIYNAVPSVFWSVLHLGPLTVFCYQYLARPWLYGILGVSLLAYALPRAWFRHWQLSSRRTIYRRMGVPLIGQFTQYGSLVNKLIRRRYPQYRRARNRQTVAGLVSSSYHMERFHVAALLFFLLCSLAAGAQGRWGWAVGLATLNISYNLYPIWLQQYLRLRAVSD